MNYYNELISYKSFEERYNYLRCNQKIGEDTFGYDRFLNQEFYKSAEWQRVRSFVISRDNGCDMGLEDYPINGRIYVHHIVPITKEDIINSTEMLLDPNNLICVSFDTHNAIHFGDSNIINKNNIIDRSPNDTAPWLK